MVSSHFIGPLEEQVHDADVQGSQKMVSEQPVRITNNGETLQKEKEEEKVHQTIVLEKPTLNLKTLSNFSDEGKKSFIPQFSRSVKMTIGIKAKPIGVGHNFNTGKEMYLDALILAMYLELTSPQSKATMAVLAERKIPCVMQGYKTVESYWQQVTEVCNFMNHIRENDYSTEARFLLEKKILRCTKFNCSVDNRSLPAIVPKDLHLQNMVLSFLQFTPKILRSVIDYNEVLDKQRNLMKRLVRQGDQSLECTEIDEFQLIKAMLDTTMQSTGNSDVFLIKLKSPTCHDDDDKAWIQFMNDPSQKLFKQWEEKYLSKWNAMNPDEKTSKQESGQLLNQLRNEAMTETQTVYKKHRKVTDLKRRNSCQKASEVRSKGTYRIQKKMTTGGKKRENKVLHINQGKILDERLKNTQEKSIQLLERSERNQPKQNAPKHDFQCVKEEIAPVMISQDTEPQKTVDFMQTKFVLTNQEYMIQFLASYGAFFNLLSLDHKPELGVECRSRILKSLLFHSSADLYELLKDYFPNDAMGITEQYFVSLKLEQMEKLLTMPQNQFEMAIRDRAYVLTARIRNNQSVLKNCVETNVSRTINSETSTNEMDQETNHEALSQQQLKSWLKDNLDYLAQNGYDTSLTDKQYDKFHQEDQKPHSNFSSALCQKITDKLKQEVSSHHREKIKYEQISQEDETRQNTDTVLMSDDALLEDMAENMQSTVINDQTVNATRTALQDAIIDGWILKDTIATRRRQAVALGNFAQMQSDSRMAEQLQDSQRRELEDRINQEEQASQALIAQITDREQLPINQVSNEEPPLVMINTYVD